jgi:hypothetical protein
VKIIIRERIIGKHLELSTARVEMRKPELQYFPLGGVIGLPAPAFAP